MGPSPPQHPLFLYSGGSGCLHRESRCDWYGAFNPAVVPFPREAGIYRSAKRDSVPQHAKETHTAIIPYYSSVGDNSASVEITDAVDA